MGGAVDEATDEALVAGIGDRDEGALAEAYRRHGGAVWAVAQRVCGRGRQAEQVCEGIFTELWSRPGRFDASRGALRSRLVAEAHARAVDVARSTPARRPDDDGPTDPTPPSAEVEVAGHAAALDGARPAVDRLAPAERDVFLLVYLGGHSCREAARLLGVPEDLVKGHIRRALVNLRQPSDAQEVAQ